MDTGSVNCVRSFRNDGYPSSPGGMTEEATRHQLTENPLGCLEAVVSRSPWIEVRGFRFGTNTIFEESSVKKPAKKESKDRAVQLPGRVEQLWLSRG